MDNSKRNIFKKPVNKKEIKILPKADKPPVNIDLFSDTITIVDSRNQSQPENITGTQIGNFFITDDYGEEERIAKERKKRKDFEKNRERAYKLLAKKEFILKKLNSFDLSKKKHINEIANLNYKLEMTEWELNKIREENGFDYMGIHRASYIQKLTKCVKKKYKHFRKFILNNFNTIRNIVIGIGSAVIPMIIGMIFSKKPVTA